MDVLMFVVSFDRPNIFIFKEKVNFPTVQHRLSFHITVQLCSSHLPIRSCNVCEPRHSDK